MSGHGGGAPDLPPGAEKGMLQHKPFGLSHPTWSEPKCFYYVSEAEAREAILRVYGEDSGHVVVGVIPPEVTP